MEQLGLETPVTRREFQEELGKIVSKIDELFRAKQVSWPLILSFAAFAMGGVGFAIKSMVETSVVKAQSDSTAALVTKHDTAISAMGSMLATTSEKASANAEAIAEMRERVRATEANLRAVQIENETQNRWAADVINLHADHLYAMVRVHHPDIPPPTYWPLGSIGDAGALNGKH